MRPPTWTTNPDKSEHAADRPGPQAPADGIDAARAQIDRLRPLMRGVVRHWRSGIVGLAIGAAAVTAVAARYVPKYQSETIVYHQRSLNPESITGDSDSVADPALLGEFVMRRGRLEQLMKETGLHRAVVDEEGMSAAVELVRENTKFRSVGKNTFRISFVGESAEEARDVAAWLANALVKEDDAHRQQQAVERKKFLRRELQRIGKEVSAAEEALRAFVADNPDFAVTARDRPVVSPAPDRDDAPATAPARRRARPRPRPAADDGTTKPPPPSPPRVAAPAPPDPKLVEARQAAIAELSSATRELTSLRATYTDAHPDVKAAAARVAAAETKVKDATNALEKKRDQDIYAAIENAPPKPTAVPEPTPAPRPRPRPRPAAAEPEPAPRPAPPKPASGRLADRELEWSRLKRTVEEALDRRDRVSTELYRADVAARSQLSGQDSRVVIIDEAFLPPKPLRSRSVFYKLGVPLSLAIALALMFLRALFDDRIYGADELSLMGYDPILTVIPGREPGTSGG